MGITHQLWPIVTTKSMAGHREHTLDREWRLACSVLSPLQVRRRVIFIKSRIARRNPVSHDLVKAGLFSDTLVSFAGLCSIGSANDLASVCGQEPITFVVFLVASRSSWAGWARAAAATHPGQNIQSWLRTMAFAHLSPGSTRVNADSAPAGRGGPVNRNRAIEVSRLPPSLTAPSTLWAPLIAAGWLGSPWRTV